MKQRFMFSLMLGASLVAGAQGYQDGVDNFNAGRMEEAKIILGNTLNDASTDKAVSYYYLGNIDFQEGNLASAKANFNKGIEVNPSYAYNYIGLGEVALKDGNKGEAGKLFDTAMKADKKNTAVMVAVARAYWNVDPVAYAKDIDKLIKKAEKESKYTEAAVYVLKADMVAKNDPGEAAGLYEMAIGQDQEKNVVNREAYVKYANTYFRVNPSYAIDKLKEFYDRAPDSGLAQRELAEKYYDNSQMGSAWKMYEKYVQNPNHFRRDEQRYAGLLYSAGEYLKSIEWANKILNEDSSVYPMYRILMLDYTALKDWNAAEEVGRKLFEYPGANLIANDYSLYADALSQNGKAPEAVAIYEKAIELNPDRADLLPKLSAVYDRAGQEAQAVEVMKKYLDLGNGSVNDLFSMARRYASYARTLEKGTPERIDAAKEGLKYIDMAIEKVPDNPSLFYYKGQLYYTLNDDKMDADAAAAYQKMLECLDANPDNKDKYKSYYTAGYAVLANYYNDIDKEKSDAYFEKYKELNPAPAAEEEQPQQ